MKTNLILIVLLFLINSCFLIDNTFEVTGRVLLNGNPVKEASVSLSGSAYNKPSCETDSSGYFEMQVYKDDAGTYLLMALKSTLRSASYLVITDSVEVSRDVDLGDINLIQSIDLQVSCEQSSGTGHLTWTKSKNDQFFKYKVYRSDGEQGLTDKNGQLVYSSYSLQDTTYLDHVIDLGINTYRVDVYSNSEKIGQSNLNSLYYQPDPGIY